jgi:alditol oxidase
VTANIVGDEEEFSMTREHNWADNYTFTASRIHAPETIDEARRIVAAAPRIRAVGTRHSFNDIADSAEMIDLRHLPPGFTIDAERMTVTVGACTSYGVLAAYLQTQGYALHNMGSLPHISVAGATATGTHGSGDRNGNLSSAVAGLEIIDADGDLLHVQRGDSGFDGMVVGLGAFGVITRVALDILPTYDVRQDAFIALPWDIAIERFDAVSSAAYSVSLLTKWGGDTVNRMWLKTRVADEAMLQAAVAPLGATAAPVHMVSSSLDDPSERLNPFGGVPGPWSERLPHFRLDRQPGVIDQIQSEYMVPRPQVAPALKAMRALADRIDPLLHTTEIRTMAADALWLSPSYGHDTVAIHFTWQGKPVEVDAITREIEAILLPLGARPHWGKLIHADAGQLAKLYPRIGDFRALVAGHDPAGKFRNAYLVRHVLG